MEEGGSGGEKREKKTLIKFDIEVLSRVEN